MTPAHSLSSALQSILSAYQDGDLDRPAAETILRRLMDDDRAHGEADRGTSPSRLAERVWSVLSERRELPPPTDEALDTLYADLGVSSGDLVYLVERLETDLGTALPPTVLFDHPTPRRTAAFLATRAAPPSGNPPHRRRARPRSGPPEAKNEATSPSSAWRDGSPARTPSMRSGRPCSRAPTSSRPCRPSAGTTRDCSSGQRLRARS